MLSRDQIEAIPAPGGFVAAKREAVRFPSVQPPEVGAGRFAQVEHGVIDRHVLEPGPGRPVDPKPPQAAGGHTPAYASIGGQVQTKFRSP